MTDGGTYERAWRDRRWRRGALVIWLVLLFPCMWLLAAMPPVMGGRLLYLLPWLLLGAVLAARMLMFRCPRCRRFFNLSTSIGSYSIKQRIACIHCGLGIGAPHG
jgi:hypothetical protein